MPPKKILILYTSIGLGHKSIAENIGFYLEQAGYQVKLHDAHKVQGGFLAGFGKWLYGLIIYHTPAVWEFMHNSTWLSNLFIPLRLPLASFNYKHVLSVINEYQPDLIISSHNTCSAIIAYLKDHKLYNGLFAITFSDYFLHKFWMFKQADFYLANTEEQKQEMVHMGTLANKIFVCGMTVKPKHQVDPNQIRQKFGIGQQDKVVLVASGSLGTDINQGLIAKLAVQKNIKIFVLCGKNQAMYNNLSKQFTGSNVIVLSYYSPMDELYSIADLFITKPGGLSVAESLYWGVPILISHLLPGGEQFNYQYLLSRNLILPMSDDLVASALAELSTGSLKKSLAQNPAVPKLFNTGQAVTAAVESMLHTV